MAEPAQQFLISSRRNQPDFGGANFPPRKYKKALPVLYRQRPNI
jgi:hypothetical protein